MLLNLNAILCTLFFEASGMLRCSQISKPFLIDYHIMQTCSESNQKVIARTFATDLDYCKGFTKRVKGLAFNFADSEYLENDKENCMAYDCPEFNVTSLKQFESAYHYYSMYARIYPAENMTCLPKEGIYMFSGEKLNYTKAVSRCEEYGGRLINVINEESTNRAASIIAKSIMRNRKSTQAYVGLHDMEQEGKFLTLNGEPLNCVLFRSWAPGEPKNKYPNEDCVTMDAMRYWRVQQCNKTLPFICEIIPNGPLNLSQAYCTNVENEVTKQECYDYFTSAEIEVENETCNRTFENLETIRERGD